MLKYVQNKIIDLFKSNFIKDTAALQTGTMVLAVLTFIESIIFARFLGPENYGLYALIFAFAGMIEIFIHWGIDYSTLTLLSEAWAKEDKNEIKNLIIFFIKFSLFISAIIGLSIIILAPLISKLLYHNPSIGEMARWILLAIIIRFAFILIIVILQVARKIKKLTILENINEIIYIIIATGLLYLGFNLKGVIWGYFLATLIFLFFSLHFYNFIRKRIDLLPSIKEILIDFKKAPFLRYFKFVFLIGIDKILGNFYTYLPMIFLGLFVSNMEMGYFKTALTYISLPFVLLVPIARLLTVQLPKSYLLGTQQLKKHFLKATFGSTILMALIALPVVFLSKFLIKILYGLEYLPSVNLIYIFWPYMIACGFGIGIGALYRTLKRIDICIKYNIISIITIPIFYWLIKISGTVGAVVATTVWMFLPTFCLILYANYKYFKKHSQI